MMNKIYRYLMMLACALVVLACQPSSFVDIEIIGPSVNVGARQENVREYNDESRNVLLLYSAGYNSLSQFLTDDISDLLVGELPGSGRMDDVLLIYSHFPSVKGVYSVPTSPTLTRVYKDIENNVIKDTLVVYPEGVRSSTGSQLNQVLTYVKDNYPAKTYGMVFSSHATGYLPTGYYSNPKGYVYTPSAAVYSADASFGYSDAVGVPYVEPEHDPMLPMVKSVGQDQVGTYGSYLSYEIEIEDFARALPMYMDYILFDACFMANVEAAYELRNSTKYIIGSACEIMGNGFPYAKTLPHLLKNGGRSYDLSEAARSYHEHYKNTLKYSGTIALVNCSQLDALAMTMKEVNKSLSEEYDRNSLQTYEGGTNHIFFDLGDYVDKVCTSNEAKSKFKAQLEKCVPTKFTLDTFWSTYIHSDHYPITSFSGMSTSAPSILFRDSYAQTSWYKATH